MEKRVVEEGCLVLLGKKTAAKHRRTVFFEKGASVCCSSLYPIVVSTKV